MLLLFDVSALFVRPLFAEERLNDDLFLYFPPPPLLRFLAGAFDPPFDAAASDVIRELFLDADAIDDVFVKVEDFFYDGWRHSSSFDPLLKRGLVL